MKNKLYAAPAKAFGFLIALTVGLLLTPPSNAAMKQGVEIKELEPGSGETAKQGDRVQVHYTGWLMDGKKFDSSLDRGAPFVFQIGQGQVISGWEIGVEGMKVGSKRELIIPPEKGYGPRGYPPVIPGNATLKFEVKLLKVMAPAYTDINNNELKNLIARGVPIIDIRRPEEWEQTGIIEGSKMITAFNGRGQLEKNFIPELSKVAGPEDEVIVICRTGNRTGVISRGLSDQVGYKKIYNVQRGITDWIKQGNPVVKP